MPPNEFEIEIDEKGFMYLKPVVRIPIIGTKIELKTERKNEKKLFLLKKQQENYRMQSNLYCRNGFYVTMKPEQQVKPTPVQEEESVEMQPTNKFYKPNSLIRTKTFSVRNTKPMNQSKQIAKSISKY